MDVLTVLISSISALVVGVATAYVTNRLVVKREREKQERLLAEKFTEFSSNDSAKVEKLSKQFAVAFLIYLPEGAKNKEKFFIPSSGRVLVGRSKNCDLILKHPSLSRQHAIFEARNLNIFLRDLGSSAGTYVNGRRLEPNLPTSLKNEDRIKLGTATTFVFHKM